jgi:hypothetical protein
MLVTMVTVGIFVEIIGKAYIFSTLDILFCLFVLQSKRQFLKGFNWADHLILLVYNKKLDMSLSHNV